MSRLCSKALAGSLRLVMLFSATAPVCAKPTQGVASSGGQPLAVENLFQMLLGLGLVLLVILSAAWLLRRMPRTRFSSGRSLRIVEGMAMGPRERLVLVQVAGTQLLLGVAPGRITKLHVLEEPASTDPSAVRASDEGELTPPEKGFRWRLRRALTDRYAETCSGHEEGQR